MKKRFVYFITGSTIFIFSFLISVSAYDYFRELRLKADLQKVKVGMTNAEVTAILGKPSHVQMSDGSYYWCYDTNSIYETLEDSYEREIHCGHLLLEMGYTLDGKNARVVKVLDFK